MKSYEHLRQNSAKPYERTFATSESGTVVNPSYANEINHALSRFMKIDVLPYLYDLPCFLLWLLCHPMK